MHGRFTLALLFGLALIAPRALAQDAIVIEQLPQVMPAEEPETESAPAENTSAETAPAETVPAATETPAVGSIAETTIVETPAATTPAASTPAATSPATTAPAAEATGAEKAAATEIPPAPETVPQATEGATPPPEAELPPLTEMPKPEMENMSLGVLRTIDKLSARTHTFDVPLDKTVKFGNSLFIKLRACRKSSPISQPESAAFLQIWERKPHETESKWVFSGWMFASNPSLSAMDHPVYDVWLIDCKNASTSAKSEKFSGEAEPAAAPETSDNKQGEEKTPAPETPEEPFVDTEASE